MRNEPDLANDLVPVGQFKSEAASWLRRVSEENRSIVITQNGRAAAVVISPQEFDRMKYRNQLIESIARGMAEADRGETISTSELKRQLSTRRKRRRASK